MLGPADAADLWRLHSHTAPSGQKQEGIGGREPSHAEATWPLVLSTSDDNLLKNIELFDKLALRFHGRLLFLKDVLGDEICCWSFYGQGRKIAEVCCTSIVYATEKKQTKVRGVQGLAREGCGVGRTRTLDRQLGRLGRESPAVGVGLKFQGLGL